MTYRAKSLLLWLAEDERRHLVSKWSVRQVTSYGADGIAEKGGGNRWLAYAELMGLGYLEDILNPGRWRLTEEGHVKAQRLLIAGKPKTPRVAPSEKRCNRLGCKAWRCRQSGASRECYYHWAQEPGAKRSPKLPQGPAIRRKAPAEVGSYREDVKAAER